jgi:hypothetical protein
MSMPAQREFDHLKMTVPCFSHGKQPLMTVGTCESVLYVVLLICTEKSVFHMSLVWPSSWLSLALLSAY